MFFTPAINIPGNAATATTAAACSGNSATATTAAACSGNAATATLAASATAAPNHVPKDVGNLGVGSFVSGTQGVSAIAAGATTGSLQVAGTRNNSSSLNPTAVGGTWRNVSGITLGNDSTDQWYGLFQRIA